MRRVLFTAFLSLTAFSVLGGNFLQVTAPTIAGEVGDLETRAAASRVRRAFVPAGATRLSAEPITPTASQVAPLAPADAELEHSPETGVNQEGPIEVREESADVARLADARETLFISTWMELPMAAAHYLGFVDAGAARPTDNLAERSATHPDRNGSSESNLPRSIATISEAPGSTLSLHRIETLPQAPANPVLNANGHDVASAAPASLPDERGKVAQAERAGAPIRPETIAAATEAPSADFARQRLLDEPQAPVYAAPQTAIAEHVAIDNAPATDEDRGPSGEAEAPRSGVGLMDFIAALYVAPTAVFDRQRVVPEPQAPPTHAVANTEHSAVNGGPITSEERGESVSPEAVTAANPSIFDRFVTAMAELPSYVFSPQPLADLPRPPATVANATGSHDSNSVAGAPIVDDRGEIALADTDAPAAAPAPVTALVESPSSGITAQRLAALPAAPAPAVKAAPVAITAKTSMSTAMLTPMHREVLVDAPLAVESTLTAANAGDLTTQFDRAVAPLAAADRVAPAQPVLISGRPEFSMDLLKPMNAATVNPFVKITPQEELAAIQRRDGFCDPNWIGPPIRFSQTVELKLEDLINQLHQRFGVNFILGNGVAALPLNVKAGSIPWNVLLRSQLFVSGVRARCIDANTIELVQNTNVNTLQDMADVETRFIKLKFLQRTGSGTVDLANRSQGSNQGGQGGGCGGNSQGGASGGGGGATGGGGGGAGGQQGQTVGQLTNNKYDKLIVEIEKILGLRSMTESAAGGSGDQGGGAQQAAQIVRTNRFVTEIPGRNILAISATKEEHALIQEFIRRADRPPFQVAIKALVYTANQDRIRDIGVQTTITGGTADGRTTGGVFGDTLGTGTLFDFSTVIGTFDFNVQATAFQQNGLISVKSRPFATVIDGLCTTLDVGRQLPIVIDATLGGQGDVVFVNAANNLAVTPYVLDDENGNPFAVTLELRLAANDIDSSVTARGVPAISARSIQTQLLLDENKTAILGGFTVDSDSRTDRKVPGLGDIPVIGELFRRRIRDARVNRLYFAISVDVIVYPDPIRTVDVPGATTDPPSITPKQKRQADKMEPEQVIAVPTPKGP